jgi:hypothetical protein
MEAFLLMLLVVGLLITARVTIQPVEKVSKVELGHIPVRMGDESSTLMCYGKMFSKDELPLTVGFQRFFTRFSQKMLQL